MKTYDRERVEDLLEFRFDPYRHYGLTDDGRPDPDMPRGSNSQSTSGTWMAELADINRAWQKAPLTRTQRRRLLMYYGLGWSSIEIGEYEDVAQQVALRSVTSGVEKIEQYLNKRRK